MNLTDARALLSWLMRHVTLAEPGLSLHSTGLESQPAGSSSSACAVSTCHRRGHAAGVYRSNQPAPKGTCYSVIPWSMMTAFCANLDSSPGDENGPALGVRVHHIHVDYCTKQMLQQRFSQWRQVTSEGADLLWGCLQDTTAQQRSEWRTLGLQLLAQVGTMRRSCTHKAVHTRC